MLACLAAAAVPASLRDLGAEGQQVVFEPAEYVVNRNAAGQVVASYIDGVDELPPEEEAK
ncbi:MAG: hypothetical protein LBH76_07335 [Propionibacteriaceae bacterium]|nr:hypothetical protein [Propionibacteriaceae bacterium]